MEATALSLGKSVLNGALGYAKSAFAEEVALQLGVQRDHAFITDELEMMQSFLMEAHEERGHNKVVKTWVKQVRNTAYDVEDTLQDFAVRLQNPSWWRFPRTLLERRRVAKKMKELRANVEDVCQRNVRYHLITGSGSKAAPTTDAIEQSSAIAAAVLRAARHNNERVDLVELLINKEGDDLEVIAVCGTGGGIGQTSVIRAAYENPDVQSRFPARAWVRVMYPFSLKEIVQSLVDQFRVDEEVSDLWETENLTQDLAQEFNERVKDKRCLIVLNELSTIEEWDRIKRCFRNIKKGSRVIVSTAQVEVARLCTGKASQLSEPKQLYADQTLYAFHDKGCRKAKDPMKPVSSSDVATTSTNNHTMVPDEITQDQTEGGDEAKVDRNSLSRRPSFAPFEETQLIGRDKEISKIIKSISNKDIQQGQVISVWGMGGLGKTTLVSGIYQSPELLDMFEKCAFVPIMRPFRPDDLLRNLASQLQEKSSTKNEPFNNKGGMNKQFDTIRGKDLTLKLKELLETKGCCLIVLDDLSSIAEWDQIIQKSCWMGKTTWIIVTTREENIAKHCSGKDGIVYNLEVLNEEDALNLFNQKVFEKDINMVKKILEAVEQSKQIPKKHGRPPLAKATTEIVKQNPNIVEEVNQILMNCGGLPLAKAIDLVMHDHKLVEAANQIINKCDGLPIAKYINLVKHNPELVEEANQILKKCGGLPLAIVTIGGFLANQPKTPEVWRKLNENISAELEMNPELGMIRTVLQKSYDGLPYYLKSCFLYLSIFPEDMTISRRRLVQRWAAEGYSTEAHGKSAIEIADGYFMELKNRSMILPSQQSVRSRKSIDSCKVHDLIRDIAISKAAEENLVFRLEEGCSLNTHGTIRHIAISSNWNGDKNEFESLMDMSRIRSLSLFGEWKRFFISDKMRLVRVLDLEGTRGLEYHHLDHIWKLIHLKYLSLRRCSGIELLPDSLGNLRQLQILDVKWTYVRALPKTIIKLRKLSYIHAGHRSMFVAQEKSGLMERCVLGARQCATCCVPILVEIGSAPHKALTRRDACTYACCVRFPALVMGLDGEEGATVPRGIRKLKGLHTLVEVKVGRGNTILRDIKMLTGLRKLGVVGINKKNGMAFCSAVSNLSKLESLSVRSAAGNPAGLRGCLDEISSPLENLQSLKLYGKLETLPEWIGQLQHLVKLKLASTRLLAHGAAMELLGKLPKLEILIMFDWQPFEGEELDFQSRQQAGIITFGSLRMLDIYMFRAMIKVKSVKFEEGKGTMPKLERLLITAGTINDEFGLSGLQFLPSINQVQLRVAFSWDGGKTTDENIQEDRRRKGELKKKIQEQLGGNTNEPIVTVD